MDDQLQRDGYRVSDIYDFEMYEREFGKNYDDAFSKRHRMDIYLRNKRRIEDYNAAHGKELWGINRFTDEEDFELSNNYFMKIKGPEPELPSSV